MLHLEVAVAVPKQRLAVLPVGELRAVADRVEAVAREVLHHALTRTAGESFTFSPRGRKPGPAV